MASPLSQREEEKERAGAQNSCGRKLPSTPDICGAAEQFSFGAEIAVLVCGRAADIWSAFDLEEKAGKNGGS